MSNGKENMTVLIKYPQQNKITNADFFKRKDDEGHQLVLLGRLV